MLALLLATLRALTSDYWTVYELAEHLGVGTRTAWRLIAAVRAQCPLERYQDGGPGAVSHYRLPRRGRRHSLTRRRVAHEITADSG
ncbi:MAG: HTH domain-containing protein [Candidatus Rokubacteria bacterium]|nr:HTH domain-containing protein [Candidatus Rokubacteria bacterium]